MASVGNRTVLSVLWKDVKMERFGFKGQIYGIVMYWPYGP
jgi:hypothetical protein